jgi:hypothetical protein
VNNIDLTEQETSTMTTAWKILSLSLVFAAMVAAATRIAAAADPASTGPTLGLAFTELPPSIEQLRFAFACEDGFEIEVRWIAQNVDEAAPPNYVIATKNLVTRKPLNLVTLSRPTNGWPLGLYRLELIHNNEPFHVEHFVIDRAPTK